MTEVETHCVFLCSTKSNKKHTYYFEASSREDMLQWFEHITAAQQRAHQRHANAKATVQIIIPKSKR